jgi:5-formaminoimidazole-4-carboxamide-1-(beta)-D-ribofuranosyl 5'-monophosphate synthetase
MNERVKSILSSYNLKQISIGTICSHSALQILWGARQEGFKTVGIVKPDRRPVYDAYPAARPDYYIEVKDWDDILDDKVQRRLLELNTIIVPHGSFVEYIGPSNIKGGFNLPVPGQPGYSRMGRRPR